MRYLWNLPIRAAAAESGGGDGKLKYSNSNGREEMGHKMQLMVVALGFSTLLLVIR